MGGVETERERRHQEGPTPSTLFVVETKVFPEWIYLVSYLFWVWTLVTVFVIVKTVLCLLLPVTVSIRIPTTGLTPFVTWNLYGL